MCNLSASKLFILKSRRFTRDLSISAFAALNPTSCASRPLTPSVEFGGAFIVAQNCLSNPLIFLTPSLNPASTWFAQPYIITNKNRAIGKISLFNILIWDLQPLFISFGMAQEQI